MEQRRLFSVGDLCVDVLQEISRMPLFGEENALRRLDFSVGGNAANFAVIASKLGLQPRLVSAIGNDFATPFLQKQLAKEKVKADLIKSRGQNAFSIIIVNKRGERAIQSVKNCLNEINAEKVGQKLLRKLERNDIVFFGGYYHLKSLHSGFPALLAEIKKRKAIILFDTCFDTTGKWNIDALLPLIDYLFVNDIELQHLSPGLSMKRRVESLFKRGSKCVVVKQADMGSTLFVKGFPAEHFPSVARKAVDTTGAGDAFNAGFVFGLVGGWSLNGCTRAGNFVAAEKISHHGLAAPKAGAVNRFLPAHGRLSLAVVRNCAEMSRLTAQKVIDLVRLKPNASFLLPTGKTPKQLYGLLALACRRGEADFSKAGFFALDEYAGLSQDDKRSFSHFLRANFLDKVNAKKENTHLLNGMAPNLARECARHETAIKRRGIDMCILGIGRNGHIAFNEPGSSPDSKARVVELTPETRKVNGKGFQGGLVPARALTAGLGTIRGNSAEIILLASGKSKRAAVFNMLRAKDFMRFPAVTLRWHKNVMVIADKAASKGV